MCSSGVQTIRYSTGVVACDLEDGLRGCLHLFYLPLLVGIYLLRSITLGKSELFILEFPAEIYFRYLMTYYIVDAMRIICFPLRVLNYYHEINDLCEVTFLNMYYFYFILRVGV